MLISRKFYKRNAGDFLRLVEPLFEFSQIEGETSPIGLHLRAYSNEGKIVLRMGLGEAMQLRSWLDDAIKKLVAK